MLPFQKIWKVKNEPWKDRTDPKYIETKKFCQEETGVLIWIASKTRPDIAGAVSIAATLMTFNPEDGTTLIRGIWRYLAATTEYYLEYGHVDFKTVFVYTDASFAPGGDRSRTGVTVYWKGGLVFWFTKRQPLTTLSTPESELGGSIPGIKFGIGIKELTDQLNCQEDPPSGFDLRGDNTAMVITTTKEVTSWRSRHYALQAGWARDQVYTQPIRAKHISGKNLPADALTKILQGSEIEKARHRLTLRNGDETTTTMDFIEPM